MSALLDALGYVGDAMGKPGRAVRGVLGGHLDEALAAIPFSDSLGLTDESRKVSGADLIGADPESTLGMLGGMGVEMALDPLNLVSGAGLLRMSGAGAVAAAKAGQAARAVGNSTAAGRGLMDAADIGRAAYGGVGRGGVADMLANRRNFTIAKDIEAGGLGGDLSSTFRPVGGMGLPGSVPGASRGRSVGAAVNDFADAVAELGDGLRGSYYGGVKTAVVNPYLEPGRAASTLRHETMHGLLDSRASGLGQPMGALPEAIAAATAGRTGVSVQGGRIADEALARYAGGGMDSVRGFLADPPSLYVRQAREGVKPSPGIAGRQGSPLMAKLLDSGKLKYLADPRAAAIEAAKFGAVVGTGTAGIYGLNELLE